MPEAVLCSDIAGRGPGRKSAVIAVGNLAMMVDVVSFHICWSLWLIQCAGW